MKADTAALAASPLANRYAQALFALAAEQGVQDQVAGELAAFQHLLREHRPLRDCLFHPCIPSERKQAVTTELLGAKLLPLTLGFLRLLIGKRRLAILAAAAARLDELIRRSRGILPMRLASALTLTPARTEAIRERLSAIFKRRVELALETDAGLLGGITLRAESRLIDGSARGRLEAIRRELTSN